MSKRAQQFIAQAITFIAVAFAVTVTLGWLEASHIQSKAESMTAHLAQEWRR